MTRLVAIAFAGLAFTANIARAAESLPLQAAPSGPLPGTLPLRREAPAPEPTLGWWPSLALLTFAGAGGAWTWWRRRTHSRPLSDRELQNAVRLSSAALTPHASVHVVRWNGEELLVACTAQQVALLARRPAATALQERE